ncbi:type II toxin-antitoxin system RelE/ParE family toxin [Methyloprofundus sp.]|uniref:type II toxin-antitoxin system RelE/ParE family toxin n=1 Tax=Methyloprofundus sp. TaxID=2020875 RepID=UPI003D0DC6D7
MEKEKPIYWIGSSLKDLLTLPDEVKREAGYQLHRVQNGLEPENWKPFQEIGSGVKEIRIYDQDGAFRVMYVAKFSEKIYVLHAFQQKSQKTNQNEINIAKTRYKAIQNETK